MNPFQSRADVTAIGLSVACILHCLALPLALTLLPTLPVGMLTDEQFHRWLLVAIVPASTIALVIGCRNHKSLAVPVIGSAGMLLLLWAGFAGHDTLGETGERVVTVIGALVIAAAHIMNQRLCRKATCEC